MNIEQIKSLIETDPEKAISTLENYCLVKSIEECINQYLPDKHEIHNKSARPDKVIYKEGDDSNAEDKDRIVDRVVPVHRLALPMQKKIVLVSAAFLGIPVAEAAPDGEKETALFELTGKVLKDNKMDYKFKTIAKYTMSQKQCAELWYTQKTETSYWDGYPIRKNDNKFRVKILAKSLGDSLYPVFDSYGDMIAFGRAYDIKQAKDDGTFETVNHFDLYTDDRFYFCKKTGSGAWLVNKDDKNSGTYVADNKPGIPNIFKKIPVIYYNQPLTEWADVQPLIERLETKISNHADTNDYFDSPIVFAEGDVEGFSGKGEQGKVLEGKNGAKVSYLTWDMAPESMKMEIENLLKFIHTFTHTPDISFENMKGLGVFSGIAIKMLFLDAHLKASDKEELFGEGVQRRINYIKNAIAIIDESLKPGLKLDIKPTFRYFLPENIEEQVDVLVKAVDAKLMSRKTAISANPLVTDPKNEIDLIDSENNTQPTDINIGSGGK